MSNWQTVRQMILDELDRPNDGDLADRALCEALEFCQKQRFWFNRGSWEIFTVANQYAYDLPSNFFSPLGDVFYVSTSEPSIRRAMQPRTTNWIENMLQISSESDGTSEINSSVTSRNSLFYSFDGTQILLAPIPDTSGDTVTGRCVLQWPVPIREYSATGGWKILDPDTRQPLNGSYTSPWFTYGSQLVKARAKMILCERHYSDASGLAAATQDFANAMNSLKQETTRKLGKRQLRGYLT